MKLKNTILALATILLAGSCFGWEPSPSFLAYMKDVEGFRSAPYQDIGGVWHIGYGHRIKRGEAFVSLTDREATVLLKADLKVAYAIASRQLGFEPTGDLAEIAVDYTFNGCPPVKFPKFFKAVIAGDRVGMEREYKRRAGKKYLVYRNKQFAERYL